MGMGGSYDRLGVAVGERLCESLADEVLEDGRVDGGHLGGPRNGGDLHIRQSAGGCNWSKEVAYRERMDDAQLQVHLTTVKPSNKRAIWMFMFSGLEGISKGDGEKSGAGV